MGELCTPESTLQAAQTSRQVGGCAAPLSPNKAAHQVTVVLLLFIFQ